MEVVTLPDHLDNVHIKPGKRFPDLDDPRRDTGVHGRHKTGFPSSPCGIDICIRRLGGVVDS